VKVLQINSVCGTGSTGKLAVQISNYLNDQGIDNYIAYGFGRCDRPNTFKFGNMVDAHLHSFLSRKLCLQGYGSWFATGSLIRYIKKIRPTIIHLHNIHGHYLNFPRLFRFLKQYDCDVVWTFHDCWPLTGRCAHFTLVGCDKWKTQCESCPQLSSYPESTRDRSKKNFLGKKKHFNSLEKLHIVTVSQWLKGIVAESFFRAKSVRRIYNGIDLDVFRPAPSDIRKELGVGDRFMVLGVASPWNKRKRYDQMLELSRRLDDDSIMVLVGVSEEQKAALPRNVIGITRTENQTQLAQIYTAADVLVNLSLEETFGLVVAEAMACGTPAVVVNSTACPEVISPETGLVVSAKGDLTELDAALAEIRKKGKQWYSAHCTERVRQEFANEKMQMEYHKLYCELEKLP